MSDYPCRLAGENDTQYLARWHAWADERAEVVICSSDDADDFVTRFDGLIFIGDGVVKVESVPALIDRLTELTRWEP